MSADEVIQLYPLQNYTFGKKPAVHMRDMSVTQQMARHKEQYERDGMRRTVEGLLLVHLHKHPHVLLLTVNNTGFRLPGGKVKPGEEEATCLKRKLTSKLASEAEEYRPDWNVGTCLATWWRPNHEAQLLPYVPPHITRPKECKRVVHVPLPERCMFAVPQTYSLMAVPLYELHQNADRYGSVLASLPTLLSRYKFVYL